MAPKKDGKFCEGDGKVVAKWDDIKTEILLKVCVEEIDNGNMPSTLYTEDNWENIQKKFQERIGYAYDRTHLKNIWDALKPEFSSFANVVGWDHDRQIIRADEEWWTARGEGTLATENTSTKEDEGDSCEVEDEVQTNSVPSSSKMNLKMGNKVGKGEEKMGTAEKPQRSHDDIKDEVATHPALDMALNLENRIQNLESVVAKLKAARFGPKGEILGANAKP